MSSDKSLAPLPNGYYHIRYGASAGLGGMYLTAGPPGTRATVQALAPQPLGKTQTFRVSYNATTRKYTLRTDAQRGISYAKAVNHAPIIVSIGMSHSFKIKQATPPVAPHPPSLKLYRIGIRVGPQALVIGQAPLTIHPPQLELQPVNPNNVWQFKKVPHLAEDVVDDEAEEEEEQSDEEYSDEFEE